MGAVERLAAQIVDLSRRLNDVETKPQLPHSTVPVAGEHVTVPQIGSRATEAKAAAAEAKAGLEQAARDLAAALNQVAAKPVILYSTNGPSGTAPQGSIWFQTGTNGGIIGQWQQTDASNTGSTWTRRDLRNEVIANLDVGKLTAGSATIVDAVVQKIWSEVVTTKFLTATEKIITKDVIATGAVTADALAARLALVTDIIAGDPSGAHVLLNQEGMRTRQTLADGTIQDAVRVGTGDEEFISIPGPDGQPVATIDNTGRVTGRNLIANDDVTLQGRSLLRRLDEFPRGMIAIGGAGLIGGNGRYVNGPEMGIFDVRFPYRSGRWYRVVVRLNTYPAGGADPELTVALRIAYEGADPQTNSPVVQSLGIGKVSGTTWHSTDLTFWFASWNSALSGIADGSNPRLLLTVGGGPTYVHPNTTMAVYDEGLQIPFTSTNNPGGGTITNPARNAYYDAHPAIWHRSFNENGTVYDDGSGNRYVYQGRSPAYTAGGIKRGMIGWGSFADYVQPHNGGAITNMELEIYAAHWWYASGGRMAMTLHGAGSYPSAYSDFNAAVYYHDFGRNHSRRIQLPSDWWPYFADGRARGIALKPPNTDPLYYGYFTPQATLHVWYER